MKLYAYVLLAAMSLLLPHFPGGGAGSNPVPAEFSQEYLGGDMPYLTVMGLDWGMTQEEVLSALGWTESHWRDITAQGLSWSYEFWYEAKAVAVPGGSADVHFLFSVGKTVFLEDVPERISYNLGLESVQIHFRDQGSADWAIHSMDERFQRLSDHIGSDGGISFINWADEYLCGEHPAYARYALQTPSSGLKDYPADSIMVQIRYSTQTDERYVWGTLSIISPQGALLNNMHRLEERTMP